MSQIATLKIHARKLRLGGLAESLETRLLEASSNRLGHDEFLELLFQDELAVREGRTAARRFKSADFRESRSLDGFDFSSIQAFRVTGSINSRPAGSSLRPATSC